MSTDSVLETIPRVSDRGARIAAGRIGCTFAEYREREANGEAWCTGCQTWHPRSAFARNAHRAAGVANYCREEQARLDAARYQRMRIRALRAAGRRNGISYAGPAFSLTPEGERSVSRADSVTPELASSCAQRRPLPSGQSWCPACGRSFVQAIALNRYCTLACAQRWLGRAT